MALFSTWLGKLQPRFSGENRYLALVPLIGALTGITAVIVAHLIAFVQHWFWGGGQNLLEAAAALPWHYRLLILLTGGLLVGLVGRLCHAETRGAGTTGLIQAIALKGGDVSLRQTLPRTLTAILTMASGAEFTLKPGSDLTTFVGTQGWIAAGRSREKLAAEPKSLLSVKIKPDEIHLLQDNNHYANFINSVLTRRTPASNIDSAAQSDFISHLGDIAIRTGRKIKWDPVKETIVGDETAARMMHRSLREPWTL